MLRGPALLLLLLAPYGAVQAQENCPWLTPGTAAALMGGPVSASVHVTKGEGACTFSLKSVNDRAMTASREELVLQILVGHSSFRGCTSGSPMTGVGEDSVACSYARNKESYGIVRGRVRAKYFIVRLMSQGRQANDKDSLRQAAEEVAGNLF